MPPKKAIGLASRAKALSKPSTTSTTRGSVTTGAAPFGIKGRKRKTQDDDDDDFGKKKTNHVKSNGASSPRKASAQNQAPAKKAKRNPAINKAPTQPLDIYVFGAGEMGELGLGRAQGQNKVKRPRLNPLLAASKAGVVSLSVGGMHTAALTSNNKILTWGINDDGALGRNTDEEDDDDLDSNTGLNFKESTPGQVDTSSLPVSIVWTQLACTDSATFALTDDGDVYGWGTFRGNEGKMGFDPVHETQRHPIQVPGLSSIIQLAGGSNHILALSNKGEVYAWGAGQQSQLSRRIIERRKENALVPIRVKLSKTITLVGAGSYHSFAITNTGEVYSWGLNSFGETGIAMQIGDGGESAVHQATVVDSLRQFGKIICIDGGSHHTVAVTERGELLVWGRLDGFQLGLELDSLAESNIIRDSAGHPRILTRPSQIPGIDVAYASAGSDHCIAIARDGKAYAWGFSENYQTGLGTNKDVQLATQIESYDQDTSNVTKKSSNAEECGKSNSDAPEDDEDDSDDDNSRDAKPGGVGVGGKKMVWAGCAGQFSILAGLADTDATGLNGAVEHA